MTPAGMTRFLLILLLPLPLLLTMCDCFRLHLPTHRTTTVPLLHGTPTPEEQAIERGWRAVTTETHILLDKIEKAGRTMSLRPEEEATTILEELLSKLVTERKSPVPLSSLREDAGSALTGRWKLAFTTDPRATFLGGPLAAGAAVELDISHRGPLEQRIYVRGKQILRGRATYTVNGNGIVSFEFERIWATMLGREVPLPGFLVQQPAFSSFIETSYFDGRLWVERCFLEMDSAGPSSKDPVAYNCWRFDGPLPE